MHLTFVWWLGWGGDKRNGVCDVANWVPPGVRQPLTLLPSSFLSSCTALQWRTEILDYCPSTRVLLIGCKTDLRTDLSTLMELSHQKQAPISYEQVGVCVCVCVHACPCVGWELSWGRLQERAWKMALAHTLSL